MMLHSSWELVGLAAIIAAAAAVCCCCCSLLLLAAAAYSWMWGRVLPLASR